MKRSHLIFALAILTSLLVVPQAFSQTAISTCQTTIDNLSAATTSTAFTNAKDQTGLLGKLSDAKVKLDQAKFADAVQKLNDYIFKLNQLIPAGKVDGAAGASLIAGANDAITCIQSIGR